MRRTVQHDAAETECLLGQPTDASKLRTRPTANGVGNIRADQSEGCHVGLEARGLEMMVLGVACEKKCRHLADGR